MPPSKTARKTQAKKAAVKKAPAKKTSAKKSAGPASGFDEVFKRLRAIMAEHESSLVVKTNKPGVYTVTSPKPYEKKKELYFGAVMAMKNYVSYHLFPLYMFPELVKGLSPELKKRKQGKACLNFTAVDEELFQQLGALTRQGFEQFRRRALV
jgi:hypothetical protein